MSKEVENIPSDKLVEMSASLHRVFNAAGCDPMCHCCEQMISVGNLFKLSTIKIVDGVWGEGFYKVVQLLKGKIKSFMWSDGKKELESKEVMLCDSCSPEKFKERELKYAKGEIKKMEEARKGGCFRVNGKIVL